MKKFAPITTLLLVILAVYWSFSALMPSYRPDNNQTATSFSTDRALSHVKQLSQKPHGVGFPAHQEVREYIMGELGKLGLRPTIQQGYTAGDWANFSRATNILARIKGTKQGKALMLLTHYDSSPHSSLGASDAGSGVATILEGLRAYLSEGKTPGNDIIILITDAEELGLNGADLFVNKHPWAKDVGLVLNFEARGSGGPGYMLIETNRGNGNLIKEFTKANPNYPVANSLAYSIYKMLPNDTDLTVFREEGDIEGFNFAFIDDHFDYHTAKDSYERLDKKTLTHQGSYLMPLLKHFSDADLNNLKSLNDYIYFNVPLFKLVSYPFEWIWPIFGFVLLIFIVLLVHGFRKKVLHLKEIAKGSLPMLLALGLTGIIGYFGWSILKWWYPQYKDILHGFTYNGHAYIFAFVCLSVAICFWSYHKWRKISTANLLVAPIIIWLIICGGLAMYLPGASFFVIPLIALLSAFFVLINQEEPNPYLLVLLSLPAIWMLAPFVKMFPVGLGLKMMIGVTLLSSLIFLLLLPLFGFYKHKNRLSYLGVLLFIGFMVSAHFDSDFDQNNAKPTSLLYVLDADKKSAMWATYEHVPAEWTSQYVEVTTRAAVTASGKTISSKYSTGFTYTSEAPLKEIPPPDIQKVRDTVIGENRILEIRITPKRNVNRLEIFTNTNNLKKAKINQVALSPYYLKNRRGGKLVTHYISDNEFTELNVEIPKGTPLEITVYEASNDLLNHPDFTIPRRPANNIPMPFVLNDAVLVTKTIRFE
ncbi:M28 family peptidase [Muriicola sp. Z0-33]|uniref:M28 family peptidase n=1 Tax=Muriicola sp. Z0-33 TaxID=2816957 RepID=UPI0022379AD6|nr:M28 family peptidase [Muriicola sp. Z0-33]MCW5517777.1 M28 family peptidase [Muriicola sp. Z0-33]